MGLETLEIFAPLIEEQFEGIDINVRKADLTLAEVDPEAEYVKLERSQWGDILVVPDEEWDLAFYDVLAHYVSDEKISDLYVLLNGIKPGGLAFIRDIGQLK